MSFDDKHIKTYSGLGIPFLSRELPEHIAECPFCDSDKMYVNAEEGFFDCKVCGQSGNKYTFIQLLYDKFFSATTSAHYADLSAQRGNLPEEAFQDAELAYDQVTQLWYIPVRNEKGTLVNLRIYSTKSGILSNLAGCKVSLYNLDRFNPKSPKIILCEGEWDAIAMEWFLTRNKVKDTSVLAVPGAAVFKQEWAKLFTNKEVILCYDNDDAGRNGMSRAIKTLRQNARPKGIKTLVWPESTPERFDVRDYITRQRDRVERGWKEFNSMLEDVPLHNRAEDTGVVRTEFNQVVEDFRRHIHVDEDYVKGMLFSFAVVLSNKLGGEPLWLMLVGPPGSGKTLLLQSLSDNDYTHYESSLGPKTLVSGYKMTDGSDPSLLPQIIGKTLIIKEYTEIMSLSGADQDQLFAVLRGAYDGRVERTYPHGVTRIYPIPGTDQKTCHFSILAGVTNAIHGDNRAALGERFLKYQLFPDDYDATQQVQAAIDAATSGQTPEFNLREYASAFIEYKMEQFTANPKLPPVPTEIQKQIIGLSQVVSMIRAMVARKQGELLYRPAPEIGTRLSKQLIKFMQCVAFLLDKPVVDDEVYKLIQRLGLDTCYGWARDIVEVTAKHHPEGILKDEICKEKRMGPSNCSRCLEDLYELGALTYESHKTGVRGNPPKAWKLSPMMEKLFQMAKISETFKELPAVPLVHRAKIRRRGRETFKKYLGKRS